MPGARTKKHGPAKSHAFILFIPQGLNRIQQRRLAGWIDTEEKADAHGKEEGQQHRCRGDHRIEAAEPGNSHGGGTAKAYANMGLDTYFYNFNYDPAILKIDGLNTAHGMELPFVFGNGIGQRRATKISNLSWVMQQSWVNFIKSGDPNFKTAFKGQVIWPKFEAAKKHIMVFDAKLSSTVLPCQDDLDFLENLMFPPN